MSLEQTLAKHFLYQEGNQKRLRNVVKISTIGIALGISLILISLFVVQGFKQEIERKINGFVGTIRISNPDNNYDQYTIPLEVSPDALAAITEASKEYDPKALVHTFIDQMALIKVDSAYRAIAMHGVDSTYDRGFYEQYLISGNLPSFSGEMEGEVLMSKKIAEYLSLNVGDDFLAYYLQDERARVRKYSITGLMETGFDQYDDHIVIADIRTLRSVVDWSEYEVSGITVTLPSRRGASGLYEKLFTVLADRHEDYGERYAMFTVEELNYNYFSWLDLLDANVLLILGLMIAVAAMTIITGIVVLILEKVRAIATLKALGQRNSSLRRTFTLMAIHILFRGMLWGNAIAIVLGLIQRQFRPIPLDASQYYMTHVPIVMDLGVILLTNLLVFLIVFLFILIPTSIISNIKPSKSLRFE